MAVLRNGTKCLHTKCMLRFFNVSCLALNTNLIFEIGSNSILSDLKNRAKKNDHLDNNQTPVVSNLRITYTSYG